MSEEARLAAVLEVRLNRIDEKLSAYNQKIAGSMRKASKDMEATNDNWEKLFAKKPNLAKALDGVVDNTRLKVLDSGVARVGLLGSALEDLGPYGLAAAAAIGAVTLALGQAREAAAYADEIGDVANKLHVTTDALQEYRYAVRLAGGEEKGADEALESFGVTLGKAQANLPKAVKGFAMLGFTKDQIDSFRTVEDGLVAVTGRIEKLKSNPQKDAIISQLGLDGMKPLIEEGVGAMARLLAEAQEVGVVMDAGMVARGGEANDKFETLEKVISVQLKSAFIDLAPVLMGLLGIAADLAHEFADIASNFQAINNRSTQALRDKRDQLVSSIASDRQTEFLPGAKEYIAHKQGKLDAINAELGRREAAANGTAPTVPTGTDLIDPAAAAAAAAARLKALQRTAASQQLIDEATRNELAARQGITNDIETLLRLQEEAVDAETKRANDRIASDLAQNKITQASADLATTLNNRAADAKKTALQWAADDRTAQEWSSSQREISGIYSDIASTLEGLARTTKERRTLSLQELAAQHVLTMRTLKEERDRATVQGRGSDVSRLDATIAAENDRYNVNRRAAMEGNLDPLAAWMDRAPQSIDELNEAFQSLDAQGLDSLNQGLADAIVNSRSLGSAAANVFKQLEVQILQMLFQAGEAKALSFLGFATGGHVSGPGSGTSDSIPAMLSNGEFVVRADEARKHRRLLEAINSGNLGHFAGGGSVGRFDTLRPLPSIRSFTPTSPTLNFDLRGAVVTEDLLMQMQSMANRARDEGASIGARGGAALAASRLHDSASRRLGR